MKRETTDLQMNPPAGDRRERCLNVLRLAAAAQLLLMLSTWKLWWGMASIPAVPLVPLVPILDASTINVCSQILSTAFAVLLVAMVAAHSIHRIVPLARPALALAIATVLLNQQRLQPWHWLFILILLQACLLKGPQLQRCLRLTIVSLYVFSAVSRITVDMTNSMSFAMIRQAAQVLLPQTVRLSDSHLHGICYGLILGEILTGVLLLLPRLQHVGVMMAVCLHLVLVAVLGPLGLNHHGGVLLWNLFLAACVPLLFCSSQPGRPPDSEIPSRSVAGHLLTGFVLLFPLSGLFGIADNWLSWQVYSSRPETIRLLVDANSTDRLPAVVQSYLDPALLFTDWHPVRMDRWSLDDVNAPLYPEDRFLLAIVRRLVEDLPDGAFRVEINRPAIPLWWNRESISVTRHDHLKELIREFLLPTDCQMAEPQNNPP